MTCTSHCFFRLLGLMYYRGASLTDGFCEFTTWVQTLFAMTSLCDVHIFRLQINFLVFVHLFRSLASQIWPKRAWNHFKRQKMKSTSSNSARKFPFFILVDWFFFKTQFFLSTGGSLISKNINSVSRKNTHSMGRRRPVGWSMSPIIDLQWPGKASRNEHNFTRWP